MKLAIATALTAALASFAVAMPVEDGELNTFSELDEAAHVLLRRGATCEAGARANTADCKSLVQNLINGGTAVIYAYPTNEWRFIAAYGNCYLYGQGSGTSSTSSYSRDVGYGARSIVDTCASGGTVAGHNTAGGNGNFKIWMTELH